MKHDVEQLIVAHAEAEVAYEKANAAFVAAETARSEAYMALGDASRKVYDAIDRRKAEERLILRGEYTREELQGVAP